MTRGLRLLDAAGLEQKGDCNADPGIAVGSAAWQAASRKRRGSCSPDLEDAPGMHRYSVRSTGRSFIIVSLCFGASS